MNDWNYIVTDSNGTEQGELRDASGRTTRRWLSQITTGSFTIQTRNPWAGLLCKVGQTMIKVYRNGVLLGFGPIVPNYSKVVGADSQTIQLNWAGVGWRLTRRLVPASISNAGVSYPAIAGNTMDRGAIWLAILSDLLAAGTPSQYPWHSLGLVAGTVTGSSQTAVGPWFYKNAMEALGDLSSGDLGFEWTIDPVEPAFDALSRQYFGIFSGAASLGSYKPDVAFVYGEPPYNVASWTEDTDWSGAMNQGYILPSGFPDNATQSVIGVGRVTDWVGGQWQFPLNWPGGPGLAAAPLYEDVIQSDLVSDDMRKKLLTEHVTIRSLPRQVIRFQPAVNSALEYGIHFQEGDVVPFKAVEYGATTIDANFRIYGVDFAVDDEGNETATPTLTPA